MIDELFGWGAALVAGEAFWPLVASALVVGLLVGLTGVGGGAVMTPVLILGFGINPVIAVATDLIFATVTKLVSALIHSRAGSVDWRVAGSIWMGSLPGTALGLGAVLLFLGSANQVISVLLAIMLVLTSISMLFSRGFGVFGKGKRWAAPLGGSVIGFAVATTSVGAGALGMALLRGLLGDRDPKRLVGTDIVHAIPVALIAGAGYAVSGFLDLTLLATLLVGSLPGVIVGSLLVGRVHAAGLRRLVAVALLAAAAGVLLKVFGLL